MGRAARRRATAVVVGGESSGLTAEDLALLDGDGHDRDGGARRVAQRRRRRGAACASRRCADARSRGPRAPGAYDLAPSGASPSTPAAVTAHVDDAVAQRGAAADLGALDVARAAAASGAARVLGCVAPRARRPRRGGTPGARPAPARRAERGRRGASPRAARTLAAGARAASASSADRLSLDELEDLVVLAPLERGHRHLVTQDARRARGRLRLHGLPRRRGARGRDRLVQLRGPQHPAGAPRARRCTTPSTSSSGAAESVVLRTHTSPVQIRLMEAAVREGSLPAARRGSRARVPARHPRREPPRRVPPDRGSRRRRGHHVRGPRRDDPLVHRGLLRRRHRRAAAAELLPVHRAVR